MDDQLSAAGVMMFGELRLVIPGTVFAGFTQLPGGASANLWLPFQMSQLSQGK
jgi:hypothetical protein